MKFIDEVKITIASGNGGPGATSFRRERFVALGGPDGGDGGKGGSVYAVADSALNTLYHFRGKKYFTAKNGVSGSKKRMSGKRGEDVILTLPIGSIIRNAETGEVLVDLLKEDEKILLLEGGKGGLGNWHFKNSINQAPTYSQPGLPGESMELHIELKSVADVGLVGFPNAGKSTFISVVSNAKPKIADYPFTTLVPNLGIVNINRFTTFVIADIPGIIEGAHEGIGLGLKFLKHIERTKIFLYVIEFDPHIPLEEHLEKYKILQNELFKYSDDLKKRPFLIAISKLDMIDDDDDFDRLKELFAPEVDNLFFISSPLQEGTEKLTRYLFQKLQEIHLGY